MNEGNPNFILSRTEMERLEHHSTDPKELVLEELKDDFEHYFSPRAQEIARKIFAQEVVQGEERSLFDQERDAWWQSKYGFPYGHSAERAEIMARKYMVPEELLKRRELQRSLFRAVYDNDMGKLNELREIYETEYPEQMEGVMVLLEFPKYLNTQERMKFLSFDSRDRKEREAKKHAVQELTQFHFLISHFVEQNSADKEFLEEFWRTLERLSVQSGNLPQSQIMRRGVLSQVAAYKIFAQLGQHPKLSHPQEDAFEAIDMWSDNDVALQIKTGQKSSDELLVDVDSIAFPGVQTQDGEAVRHINTDLMSDVARFRSKSDRYGQKIGKEIKGYYAVIPKQAYDHVTGEPSREIVERFGQLLGIDLPLPPEHVSPQ